MELSLQPFCLPVSHGGDIYCSQTLVCGLTMIDEFYASLYMFLPFVNACAQYLITFTVYHPASLIRKITFDCRIVPELSICVENGFWHN